MKWREIMMQRRFKVILEWNEDGGGYTVTVPALPGCITEGDTVEEAMENAQEAISGYLEALKLQGKPLPKQDPRMFYGEVEVSL
jgi:predicted RNase H-like HicB family nuclease